jgi:tRNA-dihydrouridine synthase B
MKQNKIGNVKLKSKSILAPLDGVNCTAFRLICKEYGAGLVYTPLIDVDDLVKNETKTLEKINIISDEKPIATQLVGSNSENMKISTQIISNNTKSDLIDINLGCPEKDILSKKAGSFFCKHPEQLKKILNPIFDNTNLPITAKIRIGWDDKTINTEKIINELINYDFSAITIHPRTTKQGYSGKADWTQIRLAKEIINKKSNKKIAIIGNGDIFKAGTAKAMIEQTKCDYVMIGRGAIGNPLIFKEINYLLENNKNLLFQNRNEELNKSFTTFSKYYEKYDNNRSLSEYKQHCYWFLKGNNNLRIIKSKIEPIKDYKQIKNLISKNLIN